MHQESSEQRELRLQTRRERQHSRQETSEHRQQRLHGQANACNDDKEFSIYVIKNSFTDVMKINVHPTNYYNVEIE